MAKNDIAFTVHAPDEKDVKELRKKVQKKVDSKVSKKEKEIRRYRREASRLSAMANKRVQRLERNDLKNTPAYEYYIRSGGKFGVAGKSYNEVQAEVARLNRFLNSATSTIRGANKVLKDMAKTTGIKYSNLTELRKKSSAFFELASKAEQYLRNVKGSASAIGYQKIWEVINQYASNGEIDLMDGKQKIESMVKTVTKALTKFDDKMQVGDIHGAKVTGWFKLPKD